MVLEHVMLVGFRNLKACEVSLSPERNLVRGPNGAGKTNFLEAVYYLGMGRSFRRAGDRELVQFDADYFRVEGRSRQNAVLYYSSSEKKIMLDGQEVRKMSDFIGWMPVVVFSFEDIWLVRGEPRQRRNYLDMAIAKMSKQYLKDLVEYRRILKQRNHLLEKLKESGRPLSEKDERLLESFDEGMISYGNAIYAVRDAHLGRLSDHAVGYCSQMGLDGVTMGYRASVADRRLTAEFLRPRRTGEVSCGASLFGPHRDDLVFAKAGRDLKTFGSEGEQRVMGLALRLAEMALVEEARHESTVKLLDEAISELDAARQDLFLASLKGQVLFATTRDRNGYGKHFSINDGTIREAD